MYVKWLYSSSYICIIKNYHYDHILNQINFCTQDSDTAKHTTLSHWKINLPIQGRSIYAYTHYTLSRSLVVQYTLFIFFSEHCYTKKVHGSPPKSDIYREPVSKQSRVSPTPFHPQTRQTCTQSVKTNILQVRRPWFLRNLTNMHLCKREVRNFISTTTIKNHYERGSEISAFGMRTRACWCVPSVRVCGSREGGPREIPVAGHDPSSVGKCQSWTVVGFSVYIACLHYEQSYILYE